MPKHSADKMKMPKDMDTCYRMDAMRMKALVEKPLPKIFGGVKVVHMIPADVKGMVGKR
jgi:hypothetical protein